MSKLEIYLWCMAGIAISVVLPIIWEAVYRYFPKAQDTVKTLTAAPQIVVAFYRVIMPYLLLGVASAITAILIVASLGDTIKDYRGALLAGYAWDSTLQKLRR